MIPEQFPEANTELQPPPGMPSCGKLWVFRDGTHCISKWRLGWKERIKILFLGHVWLWVVSGNTQPPVSVDTAHPFKR